MVKIFKHQGEPGWFLADESGAISIDGCVDLDAAIRARQKLLNHLAGVDASMNKTKAEPGTAIASWERWFRSLDG